jgi:hypothetical protein
VRNVGGNILALVTFLGESTENRTITLKVAGVEQENLRKAIEPTVQRIVDMRMTTPA